MRRRLVTLGTLLAVFLLFWITRLLDFKKDNEYIPLFTLSKTEINQIEIRQGEDILKMARSAQGDWEIVEKNG